MKPNPAEDRDKQIADLDERIRQGLDVPAEVQADEDLARAAEVLQLLNACSSSESVGKPSGQDAFAPPSDTSGPNAESNGPTVYKIGRFQIIRPLGAGASSQVYLAKDPTLDRLVALKVANLGHALNPASRERFINEAISASKLDHPNVVPPLEVGNGGGPCWIVYPFVPGPTLADWLAAQRGKNKVSFEEIASLMESLSAGIDHAHRRHIVHRDLKPANILLQPIDAEPRTSIGPPRDYLSLPLSAFIPRIADFGLCKDLLVEISLTDTGWAVGTPAYMSPEQTTASATEVGPACDLFALGIILYQVLTEYRPFEGNSPAAIYQKIVAHTPPAPSKIRDGVPRELDVLCLACLEKDPKNRPESAWFLGEEFRRFRAGLPIRTRGMGLVTTWLRWGRSHRNAVAFTILSSLVAALSLALLVVNWPRPDPNRQTEELSWRDPRLLEVREVYGDILHRAESAFEVGKFADASKELARATTLKPTDQRGLEWFELQRTIANSQREPKFLSPSYVTGPQEINKIQEDPMFSVISRDRTHIAWQSTKGTVDVMDVANGRHAHSIPFGIRTRRPIALALSSQGKYLASNLHLADELHVLELSNKRKQTLNHVRAPGKRIDLLYFAPKNDLILGVSGNEVRLWTMPDLKSLPKVYKHKSKLLAAEFHPGGKKAYVYGLFDTHVTEVTIPDLETARTFSWPGMIKNDRASFSASPSGEYLSISNLYSACLWDLDTGTGHGLNHSRHQIVYSTFFSPDGRWLGLLGSTDENSYDVDLIDLQTKSHRKTIANAVVPGKGRAFTTFFGPSGADIYSWRLCNAFGVLTSIFGETTSFPCLVNRGYALAFRPNGDLTVGGQDLAFVQAKATLNTAGEWNWEQVSTPNPQEIFAVAWSPNGKTFAVGGEPSNADMGGCRIYVRSHDGKLLAELAGHEKRVTGLAFSPDGERLVSSSWDGQVILWDAKTYEKIRTVETVAREVYSVCFVDADTIAACDRSSNLHVWDIAEEKKILFRDLQPGSTGNFICSHPKDPKLLAICCGKSLVLFDLEKREVVQNYQDKNATFRTCAFRPDGNTLAIFGEKCLPRILDVVTGKLVGYLNGPSEMIRSAKFSPDGKTLAAIGHDGKVWLWAAR